MIWFQKKTLEKMKNEVVESTKDYVEKSLEPIIEDFTILNKRVGYLESNLGGSYSKDEQTDHLQKQIEKLDPARQRAVFIGWGDKVLAETRIEVVQQIMEEKYPKYIASYYGCFCTGPYSKRKLLNVVWAEFGSTDTVQAFFFLSE